MAIKKYIDIDQGTTFTYTIDALNANGDVIDVSTSTANAQIREHYSSNTYYAFTTNVGSNTVTISMSANATANIAQGRYFYDVIVTSNTGTVTRIVEGIATINPRVTR